MDSQYNGPKIVESYLMKKRIKNLESGEELTVLRYFKFNLTEKSLIYKDNHN